jgi:hypothetical protein
MDPKIADRLTVYARRACQVQSKNARINWRTAMTRSSIIVASVLTLIAFPPLVSTMATPASAGEQERSSSDISDESLRDLLRDWVRDRPDRRDMLMDLLEDRRERRADLMDRVHDRMDRRDQLRERISSRWDDDEDGSWRDRGDLRDRLRERISSRGDDEEDGSRRGRLRERLAEGRGGGDCYFLTRSLRNEDRTLLVFVRRRVCRD